MGIEIRQPGEAKAAAQAGKAIGKSEKAKREQSIKLQQEQEAMQIAAQQKARRAALEWEQQKMALNSQQDFAHEMRMRQARLDAEARAREWEVEKMELHSRMDFEQEEKERIHRKAEYTAGRDAIDKNEGLTDEQKDMARFLLSTKYSDLSEAAPGLGLKPQTERRLSVAEQRWDLLTPEEQLQLAKQDLQTKEEKPIFTSYNVQKGLGVLSTGSPESALGIPLPVLESKEDHEKWAERNWGPHWKTLVPEAIDVINDKFGTNDLKPLSVEAAKPFILAAGGDIEEAKKLARQSGYEVK